MNETEKNFFLQFEFSQNVFILRGKLKEILLFVRRRGEFDLEIDKKGPHVKKSLTNTDLIWLSLIQG